MIGTLRERVEILTPQRQLDGGGGYAVVYTSAGTVSASVKAIRARLDKTTGQGSYRRHQLFTIRYRDDLTFETRLTHRDRKYRIIDIQYSDQKQQLIAIRGEEVAG